MAGNRLKECLQTNVKRQTLYTGSRPSPNPLNKEETGIRHESSLKKRIKGDPDLYEKYSLISRYT